MRNILKATTLESKFPLLAVEGGCIISKDADITVAYRVELPELFTVTSAEYEAIHAACVTDGCASTARAPVPSATQVCRGSLTQSRWSW